jgi:hypothetical protein
LDESEVDSFYEQLDDSNTTRDDDGLMLDKFGFIVEMDDISEEHSLAANSSKKNDDSSKLKMNQKLAIANFAKLLNGAVGDAAGPTHSMVKNFARKGFPDSMRRQAWTVITGVDKIMKEREGVYSNLAQDTDQGDSPNRSSAFKAIDKDILRTFPTHQMFRQQATNTGLQGDNKEDDKVVEPSEGEGCRALRRILRAYVSYDSDLGYCQGMNFIAAMFLTQDLPEEEAFWLLVVVMNEEPWRLRDLFNKDMSGALETLYIAEHLMIQFLPKLVSQFHVVVVVVVLLYVRSAVPISPHMILLVGRELLQDDHFSNERVHISMFATQWLMTVYTSTFPFDLISRVWDSFLAEGWKVVYRVMLALLKQNQEILLSKGIEEIVPFLLRELPSGASAELIMSLSQRISLKTRHIQKHAMEYRKLIASNEIEAQEIFHRRVAASEGSVNGDASVASSSMMMNRVPVLRFVRKLTSVRKQVEVEDLSEKLLPLVGASKFALMLHNVLSAEECSELVRRAKGENFQEILVKGGKNGALQTNVASCDRCLVNDADLAAELFGRVSYALKSLGLEENLHHASGNAILKATGLSSSLHFLKFRPGDFFAPYRDSQYKRGQEASYVTLQVYLNSGYRGGKTSFNGSSSGKHFDVKAKAGSILLFSQDLRREETQVTEGRKFVIRTDIMYKSP